MHRAYRLMVYPGLFVATGFFGGCHNASPTAFTGHTEETDFPRIARLYEEIMQSPVERFRKPNRDRQELLMEELDSARFYFKKLKLE